MIKKIGNKFYLVKNEDGREILEETTVEGLEPETVAPAGDTLTEEEKAEVEQQAGEIAKGLIKNLGLETKIGDDKLKALNEKVDSFIEKNSGMDSKLKAILGGKTLDSKELTSEEKIVGFYHALVTNNVTAVKSLSEGTDADGGYLFPNEFSTELIKELPDINVMRNEVRVIQMKRDKMDISSLVSGVSVSWTAEKEAISTTTAHFGTIELKVFKLASILYATDELIDDSDIHNVVSLIIEQFSEAIGNEEEKVIWTGNGTTQPQGLATASVPTVGTGSGDIVTDVNKLYRGLPSKYRASAKFFMSDLTMANIENVKDSFGRPLLQPSLAEGVADRLKGKAVVLSDWAPANSIYFGDMKKAYFLGDRKRMSVKLSQDTTEAFTKGQTAIRVIHRIAGKVVFLNALRKITGLV